MEIEEIAQPVPDENEILVKIHRTTVTLGDCEIRGSYLPLWTRIPLRLYIGLRKPKRITVLGQECAGEVAQIGNKVTGFDIGDRVLVQPGLKLGTYAQYLTYPTDSDLGLVLKIPDDLSYDDATTIPVGGINGLYFMKQANIQPGDRLLINGAGGSIGTNAMMIAKHLGATITAVDQSEKFNLLTELGANNCIDYREKDVTNLEDRYDIIFDIVGSFSFRKVRRILNPGGTYLTANPKPNIIIRAKFWSLLTDKNYITSMAPQTKELAEELINYIQDGIITPVIDRTIDLDQIQEAHNYVESGLKQGNLVVKVDHH